MLNKGNASVFDVQLSASFAGYLFNVYDVIQYVQYVFQLISKMRS